MIRYFSIGSGSSGNSAYVGSGSSGVLLDAGFSMKRIVSGLLEHGISIGDLDGILVTHEHRDHVNGLGVIMRKYNIPVFATKRTIKALLETNLIGNVPEELFVPITPNESYTIGDIKIDVIPIMHDAAEPVGYRFSNDDRVVAIVTDLGCFDSEIINFLNGVHGIVIEANHDRRMLETGLYPYQLKRRIASEYGHLSNEDCGRLLSEIIHDGLEWIVLAHLSKENNYDKLALETVAMEITLSDNKYRARDFEINVAPRSDTGKIYTV